VARTAHHQDWASDLFGTLSGVLPSLRRLRPKANSVIIRGVQKGARDRPSVRKAGPRGGTQGGSARAGHFGRTRRSAAPASAKRRALICSMAHQAPASDRWFPRSGHCPHFNPPPSSGLVGSLLIVCSSGCDSTCHFLAIQYPDTVTRRGFGHHVSRVTARSNIRLWAPCATPRSSITRPDHRNCRKFVARHVAPEETSGQGSPETKTHLLQGRREVRRAPAIGTRYGEGLRPARNIDERRNDVRDAIDEFVHDCPQSTKTDHRQSDSDADPVMRCREPLIVTAPRKLPILSSGFLIDGFDPRRCGRRSITNHKCAANLPLCNPTGSSWIAFGPRNSAARILNCLGYRGSIRQTTWTCRPVK